MNPNTPPPRNDDDLTPEERELAALYRRLPQAEPEHALDDAILAKAAIAAQAERSRRKRFTPSWAFGLASAAVLVLAAGVAWRMHLPERSTVSSHAAAPAATGASRAVTPMVSPPPPVVTERAAPPSVAKPARSTPMFAAPKDQVSNYEVAPPPAPPAPPPPTQHPAVRGAPTPVTDMSTNAPVVTPKARIRHIRQLLRNGDRARAIAALDAFRHAYPDYMLPDDLKALAGKER